jgi:hypothetical protein
VDAGDAQSEQVVLVGRKDAQRATHLVGCVSAARSPVHPDKCTKIELVLRI